MIRLNDLGALAGIAAELEATKAKSDLAKAASCEEGSLLEGSEMDDGSRNILMRSPLPLDPPENGECSMGDNPDKRDNRDRDRVVGDQDYEVQFFAEANGIRVDQVRQLIEPHGNDRETLELEAKKIGA